MLKPIWFVDSSGGGSEWRCPHCSTEAGHLALTGDANTKGLQCPECGAEWTTEFLAEWLDEPEPTEADLKEYRAHDRLLEFVTQDYSPGGTFIDPAGFEVLEDIAKGASVKVDVFTMTIRNATEAA